MFFGFVPVIENAVAITGDKVGSAIYANMASSLDQDREGYYIINNAQDLRAIDNDLSGNYRLYADIDLSSYGNWKPIGKQTSGSSKREDEALPFTGVFDGNGHSITGMKIRNSTNETYKDSQMLFDYILYLDTRSHYTYYAYAGLFGKIQGATIRNVMVSNATINLSYNTFHYERGYTNYYVNTAVLAGVIVGINEFDSFVIENCSVINCSMVIDDKDMYTHIGNASINNSVGGIIGGTSGKLNVNSCIAKNLTIDVLSIEGSKGNEGVTPSYIGGIIGRSFRANGSNTEGASITNCLAESTMISSCEFNGMGHYSSDYTYMCVIGGLVGRTTVELGVTNCLAIIKAGSSCSVSGRVDTTNMACFQPILGLYFTINDPVVTVTNSYYCSQSSQTFRAYKTVGSVYGGIAKSIDWFYGQSALAELNK